jgi:hypothetical protein
MYPVQSALTALRRRLGRRVRSLRGECRSLTDASTADRERPVQSAARGFDRFEPATYPPFETVDVGPPAPDARPHGVVVLNDGPKRTLTLTVEGAGTGRSFEESRLLGSGGVVRLSLQQPDRYELTVAAPGRPEYAVDIESAWFASDANVTNVLVRPDGYVRYEPV